MSRHHGLPDITDVLPFCHPNDKFLTSISISFSTCIPTYLALASSLFGYLSILAWLFAQLPQIYKNYRAKSTAGLSVYFLCEWLAGDLSNLLGAILTRQARWQIYLASYYTFVDFCMVWQWFWYSYQARREKRRVEAAWKASLDRGNGFSGEDGQAGYEASDEASLLDEDEDEQSIDEESINDEHQPPSQRFKFPKKSLFAKPMIKRNAPRGVSPVASPRTVLAIALLCAILAPHVSAAPLERSLHNHRTTQTPLLTTIGVILSWASTALYLGSRLPQIWKNHTRKSTSGLSASLFIAAFFGNFFYSLSMLLNPQAWHDYPPHGLHGWVDADGSKASEWIANAAPFFLGAAGVLMMDAVVGIQFLVLGDGEEEDVMVRSFVAGAEGTQWTKVSGWMRGWIPTSDERSEEDDESVLSEETPLLSRALSNGNAGDERGKASPKKDDNAGFWG